MQNFINISFYEKVYKLERDEAAFMEQLRQINTKQNTSINSFLMKRTAGASVATGFPSDLGGLNSIIKKKKVLLKEPKLVMSKQVPISDIIASANKGTSSECIYG
jgi:hypothetical protein